MKKSCQKKGLGSDMSGNTFGKLFTVTTFGESHGSAIGAIVDGVRPGLPLNKDDIQIELNRRRPGQSSLTTSRSEADEVEILSGILNGKATGTSIGFLIRNTDANSKDYEDLKDIFRPGHADYAYLKKYGIRDWRGGGRASGRETAMRVAAGAIAKKMLSEYGVTVTSYTKQVDDIVAKNIDFSAIESNPVRCPDPEAAILMAERIKIAKENQDSVGGIIETVVKKCPAGLGDPVFDKLDARLAAGIMSIGAIKGVEFGDGFQSVTMKGSEFNDAGVWKNNALSLKTNHSGGISGGISNGNDIILRAVIRPTCSIAKPQEVTTLEGEIKSMEIKGRHDPCICPRAVVVVEAMTALVMIDCLLIQKSISHT